MKDNRTEEEKLKSDEAVFGMSIAQWKNEKWHRLDPVTIKFGYSNHKVIKEGIQKTITDAKASAEYNKLPGVDNEKVIPSSPNMINEAGDSIKKEVLIFCIIVILAEAAALIFKR